MDVFRKNLECGARFFGVPYEARKIKRAAYGIMIPVGSIEDPQGKQGLIHMLEHMLFKAKVNADRVKFATELEYLGAVHNANTEFQDVSVYAEVNREHTDLAIRYLVELAGREPVFTPFELAIERPTILEEIVEYHDNPDSRASDLLLQRMFKYPFGEPILGYEKTLANITSKDILEAWKTYHHPKRFLIGAVGDVDFEKVAEKFDELLLNSQMNGNNGIKHERAIPQKSKSGISVLQTPGLKGVHIAWGLHAPDLRSDDSSAYELINHILTDGSYTSTLFTELREKRGLVYSVSGEYDPTFQIGTHMLNISTRHKNVPKALEIVKDGFKLVQDMKKDKFELHRSKKLNELQAEWNGEGITLVHLLDHEIANVSCENYFKREEELQKVTKEQVDRLCQIAEPDIVIITPRPINL